MGKMTEQAKRDDELIDRIAAGLRNQNVPDVPQKLFDIASQHVQLQANKKLPGPSLVATITAVALVLTLIVLSAIVMSVGNDPGPPNSKQTKSLRKHAPDLSIVHKQKISNLRPYEQIEKEINEIKADIEHLKAEAKSLDAIRKLDAMMAKN